MLSFSLSNGIVATSLSMKNELMNDGMSRKLLRFGKRRRDVANDGMFLIISLSSEGWQ